MNEEGVGGYLSLLTDCSCGDRSLSYRNVWFWFGFGRGSQYSIRQTRQGEKKEKGSPTAAAVTDRCMGVMGYGWA